MDGVELGETLVDLPDRTCSVAWFNGKKALAKFDSNLVRWRRELLGLRTAAAYGVSVPVVWHAEEGPPGVLLLGWVDGRPLSQSVEWRRVGQELRTLHELPVPAAMPRFDADEPSWIEFLRVWVRRESRLCVELQALEDDEAASMRELLSDRLAGLAEPPRALLHGDCAAHHVIVDERGSITLIDWGDVGTGDPLWDLAVLLLFDPEHEGAVLDGYEADDELRERWSSLSDVYRLVRFLGEITWLVEHGFAPTGSVVGARGALERLTQV